VAEHLGTEDIGGRLGFFGPVTVAPRPPEGYRPIDYRALYPEGSLPEGTTIGDCGSAQVPAGFYHFFGYRSPLKDAASLDEIEAWPIETEGSFTADHMAGEVERAHAAGRVATIAASHMYETAWQVRGYEEFLMDLELRPEWAESILDRLAERNLRRAAAGARAGADVLRSGDDVANQRAMTMSPATWRRFIKSRWARVYEAARAAKPDIEIWYHTDGNPEAILDELVEIGVTILNPVQPECIDPVWVKKRYGRRLVLDGTIGTQSTMPWGTPDEVRRVVAERVETLAGDGALMLSPTHTLEPEVPIENVLAFAEAARTYGAR
jgi:uroporphyrinogen decarboxylase